MRSLRPSPRCPPLRSVTHKGKRLVLPRLDVPSAFLALLLCFSAALPAVAQEPTPTARHRRSGCTVSRPIRRRLLRPRRISATMPCRSSASRSTRPASRISIGSIPTRRRAAPSAVWPRARSTASTRSPSRASPRAASAWSTNSLLTSSPDEPSSEYGLIAEWVSYPADYSSVTFSLSPQAKFQDGSPITPEDVIFSFEAQKKAHPRARSITRTSSRRRRRATTRSSSPSTQRQSRTAADRRAAERALQEILGRQRSRRPAARHHEIDGGDSGRLGRLHVKSVDAGRKITYERVKDYWAKDLPVMKGQLNFERIQADLLPRPHAGLRRVQVGQDRLWIENTASRGRRDTISPRSRKASSRKRRSRSSASRRCRRSSSICAASNSRIRAFAAPSICLSTSRKPTRSCSTISMCASAATSTIPILPTRACRRAASLRSSTR